eukprot:m.413247 g.413247  ORF g.413247 m.413247 type:complete len:151 (+) comp29047_c0_seq1:1282-1734(+)
MGDHELVGIPCDFVGFMDALKRLRKVEDLIVVRMNKDIPASRTHRRLTDNETPSNHGEACARIYSEIELASVHRVAGINHCLSVQAASVKQIQDAGNTDGLREAQSRFRMMKRELAGERLLKAQVMTHFDKRCSAHFTPPAEPPVASDTL